REARQVVRARVLVPLVVARPGLRVRRRQVYRRHHRAGRRIGRLAGVDRERADAQLAGRAAHAVLRCARQSMRSILVMIPAPASPSWTTDSLASLKIVLSRTMRVAGVTVA